MKSTNKLILYRGFEQGEIFEGITRIMECYDSGEDLQSLFYECIHKKAMGDNHAVFIPFDYHFYKLPCAVNSFRSAFFLRTAVKKPLQPPTNIPKQ